MQRQYTVCLKDAVTKISVLADNFAEDYNAYVFESYVTEPQDKDFGKLQMCALFPRESVLYII